MSATSPLLRAGTNHRTATSNCTDHAVVQDGGMLICGCMCVLIIYRRTSVLLCGVSFISVVEPQCFIYV